MKKILIFTLILLFSAAPSYGVLTKSSAIVEMNAWESLAAATMDISSVATSLAASYSTTVIVDIALTGSGAQDGVEITVEYSAATADDWTPLTTITVGSAVTPGLDSLNGVVTAGDTTIVTTAGASDAFDVIGQTWFIVDGTVAECEIVRTKSWSTQTATLAQDAKYSHANLDVISDAVYQRAFAIPMSAANVRVLVNNTDAADAIHWRAHCAKVTAL